MLRLLPFLFVLSLLLPLTLACLNDEDCSLNGLCSSTTHLCQCDSGWRSADCSELDLRPASRHTGYNLTAHGTSSWGGKIIHDPSNSKLFHLFAAEFTGGCGLDYWSPMSRIIRAEGPTPAGPFTFVDQVAGTFAHNPTVIYSPADKLYLMYHIGCEVPQPSKCTAPSFACDGGNNENGESGITVRTSSDLRQWKSIGQVLSNNSKDTWDADTTNPSPFALYTPSHPTPSILLAYRGCPYNCGGAEQINLAMASTYGGNYTRLHSKPIFENGNEDPFIWRDKRGHFHLLMHSLEDGGGFGGPKVGRHAYARAIHGPWHFNNRTLAFNVTVQFTDGTTVDFFRRERPQLYFSEDGEMTPLYLSNGVQEKNSPQSYTLIQPLRGAKAYEEQLGLQQANDQIEGNKHRRQRIRE